MVNVRTLTHVGGGSNVSEQPNKWQTDTQGHGTHVTSTIIGFDMGGVAVDGVAPQATIIPVKVLNNNGSAPRPPLPRASPTSPTSRWAR